MSDPTRLLDTSGTSPALQELLGSARNDGPSSADLARLATRLGPLLVVTAPVGAAAATGGAAAAKATTAAAGTGLLKVAVLAAVGGTVIDGGAFQAGRSYEAANAPPPKIEQVVAAPLPPVAPVVFEEPDPQPPPVVAEDPPKAAKPNPRPVAKPPAAPLEAKATEVDLLQRAMAGLKGSDAKGALGLLAQHEKDFPTGALVQEREMLAIEALVKLGRGGEARLKAEAFRGKYPTSTHLLRLDAIVGK